MVSVDAANWEFATERRSSTQRPASEAEIDDIVGLFDILDRSGHLNSVKLSLLLVIMIDYLSMDPKILMSVL